MARKKTAAVEVPTEDKNEADKTITNALGKYDNVLILGIDKENKLLNIQSSLPNFPYMHWLLNRAVFEISLFENQNTKKT